VVFENLKNLNNRIEIKYNQQLNEYQNYQFNYVNNRNIKIQTSAIEIGIDELLVLSSIQNTNQVRLCV
jgi:hypothetical protein